MKYLYIVWVGGVANYFLTQAEAVGDAVRWLAKGYDDVQIEDITTGEILK